MSVPGDRGCYCATATHGPGDPPPGFCGFCEVCGAPGHTRHHPGATPVTGAWCDRHFRVLSVLHPMTPVGRRLWQAALVAVVLAVTWLFHRS